MAERRRAKGGKKNRKHGRDLARCQAYVSRHQRERNKARRLRRYLRKHPEDKFANEAYACVKQYLPKELRHLAQLAA